MVLASLVMVLQTKLVLRDYVPEQICRSTAGGWVRWSKIAYNLLVYDGVADENGMMCMGQKIYTVN